MSGGQRQRVAIARTLIGSCKVLIFDDSLSAVDMQTDKEIRNALRALCRYHYNTDITQNKYIKTGRPHTCNGRRPYNGQRYMMSLYKEKDCISRYMICRAAYWIWRRQVSKPYGRR